jgi:hypothetical protein
MESARRIVCLNDRKQNHLQMTFFAADHENFVPHGIGHPKWKTPAGDQTEWDGYNRYGEKGTVTQMVPWVSNTLPYQLYSRYGLDSLLGPLGVMAAFGYVDDPTALYCPAFKRPPEAHWRKHSTWRVDQTPAYWEGLTDGDGVVPLWEGSPGRNYIYAGLTHYWAYKNSSNNDSPDRYTRVQDYAEKWQSPEVSPMMMSGLNIRPESIEGDSAYSHSWGYFRQNPDSIAISHEDKGVNGVFYDGSARWISRGEVKAAGGGGPIECNGEADYMSNATDDWKKANLQAWATMYAEP